MFGQGQLLNKRPNMKLFNKMNAGARDVDDDDDDFATSSFTQSKVDDDDANFNNRDPDLYDIFGKKQPQKNSETNTPQIDKKPKKEISEKKIDTKTTPKPENKTPKIDTSTKTPKPESSKKITETKKSQTPQKTAATPQKPAVTTQRPASPQKPSASPQKAVPTPQKPATTTQTPAPTQQKPAATPKNQNASPVKETGTRKGAQPSDQKEPKPISIEPQPKPMITTTKSDKKIDYDPTPSFKKPQTPLIDPTPSFKQPPNPLLDDIQFDQLQRPQFVRKGKTSAAGLIQKMNSYNPENDHIRAINPKNKRSCIRDLVMRENPTYYDDKNQEVYNDVIFPANVSQIEQLPWKCKDVAEFKRAASYYQRPVEAYSVIDPNDVTPGKFETQRLMSVLSAFSEEPSILARVLEGQRMNKSGFYYVRLFADGVWRYVTIDDMLCNQRSGPAEDARVKKLAKNSVGYETELWVSLIEKGLSKQYGSYKDMQFGSVEDFMWELTGAPVLRDYHGIGLAELQGIGLPSGLMVNVLGSENGQVRLRNPWGWLAGVTVGKPVGNEGEFVVSEKEFKERVIQCWCTSYVEGYWSVSHSVKQLLDNYSGFKVTLKEDGESFMSVVQIDSRYFRNNLVQKYEYSFVRLLVISEEGDIVGSGYGEEKYVRTQRMNLFAGNYYVFVIFDWADKCYESNLNYYGSSDIRVSQIESSEDVLGTMMGKVAMKQGQKKGSKGGVAEYQYVDEDMNLFGIGWESQTSSVVKKDLSKFVVLRKPSNLSLTVKGIEGVVGKSRDGKFNL